MLVNLASEEYAKAVRPFAKEKARFITCVFGEEAEPGKLVEKGVYVKMARGDGQFAAERGPDSQRSCGDSTVWATGLTRSFPQRETYVFRREVSQPGKRDVRNCKGVFRECKDCR